MSTAPTLAVTGNPLGLTNPRKGHGLALLGLGLFVAVLLVMRLPRLVAEVRAELDVGSARLLWLLPVGIFVLLALAAVPLLLYRGAVAALGFFVPAGAPAHLGDRDKVIPQLLIHRLIEDTYLRPAGLMALAIARLFPCFLYLTPPFRPLLGAVVLPAAVLPAALAVWIATGLFPGYLLLATLLGLGMLTAALVVSRTRVPAVHVYQNQLRLTDAGNPADLFNHVRLCLAALQEGSFPNRVLREAPPLIGILASINQFEGEALVETQPLPVLGRHLPLNGLLLDIAAVILGGLGWTLLLFRGPQPAPFPSAEFWALNASYLLGVPAALLALELSRRFLGMAYGMYNTFRFRSDLFWLRFGGTYTASKIGVGDGRGGQFFSHRERIQSDVGVELWAARIISECTAGGWSGPDAPPHWGAAGEAALAAPRYVVESVLDPHLGQRVGYLVAHLRGFRDSGDALAGVRMNAPAVGDIIAANLQMTAHAEAARLAGAPPAPGLPSRGALPAPQPMVTPALLPAPAPARPVAPAQPSPPVAAAPASAAQAAVRIVACPRCGKAYRARSGQRLRFPCTGCQQLIDAVVP